MTRAAKAKGRPRVCRRCRCDYTPSIPLQKVCDTCRKTCSMCGVVLTEDNWDTTSKLSQKKFQCKSCVAEGVRKTPNRKEWQRDYDLRRKYGITYDTYCKMARHGCAICGESEGVLVVDHCHNTGKVRGVLCNNCNSGIGFLKEDLEVLENAHGYISEWKTERPNRTTGDQGQASG